MYQLIGSADDGGLQGAAKPHAYKGLALGKFPPTNRISFENCLEIVVGPLGRTVTTFSVGFVLKYQISRKNCVQLIELFSINKLSLAQVLSRSPYAWRCKVVMGDLVTCTWCASQ